MPARFRRSRNARRQRRPRRRADALREALGRSGHVLGRKPRSRGATTRATNCASGLNVGPATMRPDEPVGEHDDEPALFERDGEHAEDDNARGDEPGRGLVHGVREAEHGLSFPIANKYDGHSQILAVRSSHERARRSAVGQRRVRGGVRRERRPRPPARPPVRDPHLHGRAPRPREVRGSRAKATPT